MAENNTENLEPVVNQPDEEAQRLYMSMVNNDAEEVTILRTKKKYKIRWLKNGQLEKLTRLLLHKKTIDEDETTGSGVMDAILEDAKLACKASAIIILDGYWKLKFNYWWLWRYFYYIKQYDNIQLEPILSAGLNATPYISFLKTMSILVNQKTTQMRMTRKEAEKVMQEMSIRQDKAEEISNEKS